MDTSLHWYAWTFASVEAETGLVFGQSFVGYQDTKLDLQKVTEAKVAARVPMTAVLVSFTYMGYMTQAEMVPSTGESNE